MDEYLDMMNRATLLGFLALSFSCSLSSSANAQGYVFSREALTKGVSILAKDLPTRVDSVTTLTGVILLRGRTVQYRYALDKEKIISDGARQAHRSIDEFRSIAESQFGTVDGLLRVWAETVVRKRILNTNCTAPETRRWIDDDVTLVHRIHDQAGIYIYEVVVTRKHCLQANR